MKHLGDPECAREIRSRLATLTPVDLGQWGTMTVGEMVCHLREAYAGAIMEPKRLYKLGGPLPPPAMKFFALRTPITWPRNVETVPELKRGAVTPPASWDSDLAGLESALTAFLAFERNTHRHPIFGNMKPWDWMRWGYLHADHHLRQFGR